MQPKHLPAVWISALGLAWIFDQLFWEKTPGISFFVLVVLCLAVGAWLTWREQTQMPPLTSLGLFAPVLFFSAITFVRREPLTLFLGYSLTLAGMLVVAMTWLGGRWWQYSLGDYVYNFFRGLGFSLSKPLQSLKLYRSSQEVGESSSPRNPWKPVISVLVGLILALPVLLVLAALLAAADPIFEKQLGDLLDIFSIDKISEYIFRGGYILVGAYLLCGVYLYALMASKDEHVAGESPRVQPILGWIEASTLLGSVNLLFSFFVAVQFRYFFGGNTNINLEGYTYSEYARRGFGELVMVACISLLLFLGLSTITRREDTRSRQVFSGLGILLVILVGVILASAFQRLLLYEAAYGFSRLRTYPHVFMVWLGLLLLATVVLEVTRRMRYFALAFVLACLGFGATLSLLNVDGFIVRQNVARVMDEHALDTVYLVSLSDDAVPALFNLFHDSRLPQSVRDEVGGVLACRAAVNTVYTQQSKIGGSAAAVRRRPWPSFHWSQYRAEQLFEHYADEVLAYPVERESGEWKVKVNGNWTDCQGYSSMMID